MASRPRTSPSGPKHVQKRFPGSIAGKINPPESSQLRPGTTPSGQKPYKDKNSGTYPNGKINNVNNEAQYRPGTSAGGRSYNYSQRPSYINPPAPALRPGTAPIKDTKFSVPTSSRKSHDRSSRIPSARGQHTPRENTLPNAMKKTSQGADWGFTSGLENNTTLPVAMKSLKPSQGSDWGFAQGPEKCKNDPKQNDTSEKENRPFVRTHRPNYRVILDRLRGDLKGKENLFQWINENLLTEHSQYLNMHEIDFNKINKISGVEYEPCEKSAVIHAVLATGATRYEIAEKMACTELLLWELKGQMEKLVGTDARDNNGTGRVNWLQNCVEKLTEQQYCTEESPPPPEDEMWATISPIPATPLPRFGWGANQYPPTRPHKEISMKGSEYQELQVVSNRESKISSKESNDTVSKPVSEFEDYHFISNRECKILSKESNDIASDPSTKVIGVKKDIGTQTILEHTEDPKTIELPLSKMPHSLSLVKKDIGTQTILEHKDPKTIELLLSKMPHSLSSVKKDIGIQTILEHTEDPKMIETLSKMPHSLSLVPLKNISCNIDIKKSVQDNTCQTDNNILSPQQCSNISTTDNGNSTNNNNNNNNTINSNNSPQQHVQLLSRECDINTEYIILPSPRPRNNNKNNNNNKEIVIKKPLLVDACLMTSKIPRSNVGCQVKLSVMKKVKSTMTEPYDNNTLSALEWKEKYEQSEYYRLECERTLYYKMIELQAIGATHSTLLSEARNFSIPIHNRQDDTITTTNNQKEKIEYDDADKYHNYNTKNNNNFPSQENLKKKEYEKNVSDQDNNSLSSVPNYPISDHKKYMMNDNKKNNSNDNQPLLKNNNIVTSKKNNSDDNNNQSLLKSNNTVTSNKNYNDNKPEQIIKDNNSKKNNGLLQRSNSRNTPVPRGPSRWNGFSF